ncbi:MAG TPA: glycoside hydrolase family 38 C-terminal domain-containing protein [Candidatus Acidoferrales bacterium]|nr:glycoside hydrolase family 38 C-terminal domain-containing protein [Candidatus Acidoferrales bacterium]
MKNWHVRALVAGGLLFGLVSMGSTVIGQSATKPVRGEAAKNLSTTAPSKMPNLRKQPTLYLVGYAHLDTQWRWEYPQVISEYLLNTMKENFALFPKYPHYIFNWTGANRYMMMKEYYPADFAKIRHYVATGQWFPAGSSMEENDVNSPSPESIIRQVLYGNEYFRREFGKASDEYMLPDCFGFPADLPSILYAAGVKGFSTQKLTWGSSAPVGGPDSPEETPVGTPFNVGMWIGPDGHGVIAALNPGSYSAPVHYDLTASTPPPGAHNFVDWPHRVDLDGKASGAYTDYHYYGTGDIGGSPDEASVKLIEEMITKSMGILPPQGRNDDEDQHEQAPPTTGQKMRMGMGALHVVSSPADQMFKDIVAENLTGGLPKYHGDLELTNHSAGSLTSEAVHKRWNRENENLARAAEAASVAADWLGSRPYPFARLNYAWRLVLGGQFHDIMAGTATPKAYTYSWNDDVLAMNQFAQVLKSATNGISSELDTETKGTPIIVYNPLSIERQDVVEAKIKFAGGAPQGVRAYGPDGGEVPAQLSGEDDGISKVLFLAKVPSVGYAVYDIEPSDSPVSFKASDLKVTAASLENARYRIELNQDGDVSSIYDKKLGRELLSSPMRLAFQTEKPSQWPAWNMDWSDQSQPPRGYVEGICKVTIAEDGPVRVALRVERETESSKFVQTISLSAGDAGNRVEFGNIIDWKTREAALKAVFPLTASNPMATYNWGAGTIQRSTDNEKTFEMASHRWFDLTDKSDDFGVTILSGAKTGSDKPDDNTLRLTLLYTPGVSPAGQDYRDQATQDWGHHEFTYGLASHAGNWDQSDTPWQAYRLDDPLIAFQSAKHAGTFGKALSLLRVSSDDVRVMAFKKAEDGKDEVLRLVEMTGKAAHDVRLSFNAPVVSVREINGQELPMKGQVAIQGGELVTDLSPYEIKSYEVAPAPPHVHATPPISHSVAVRYDLAVTSNDGMKSAGGFDAAGDAIPAEMLPTDIPYAGIHFHLAPSGTGKMDAVVTRGQTIELPVGRYNRVYILAASSDGDQKATFRLGDRSDALTIQDWGGFIGQWYDRSFTMEALKPPVAPDPSDTSNAAQRTRRFIAYIEKNGPIMLPHYAGIAPGFIKRAPVAWFASHHHTADGANVPYSYSYLFAYALDVPAGVRTLTLPDNDKIRVMAITVAQESDGVTPAMPLYDINEQVAGRDQ